MAQRGPQTWTSASSSQISGCAPSTRAWIERSAARGMLSCRPAHAATRSERAPARQPLLERAGTAAEREDLVPGEVERSQAAEATATGRRAGVARGTSSR